ncbi:MAG TPA: hypothetical protein VF230_00435 [Acidimicrobiales bacterium]
MAAPTEFEPLDIVGIVADEVGSPRNDGSRGSALYRVPIRLSRSVTGEEAALLRSLWDNPPSFTTMHRPGIARVSGNRFVLDGTTIDEVGTYHAATLRGVVDRFNKVVPPVLAKRRAEREAAAEAEWAHRSRVAEQAEGVRFDR